MKLAFTIDPHNVRIPFSPAEIWTSDRGLTGSEIASFQFASCFADMGHDVVIYTKLSSNGSIDKVTCLDYGHWLGGGYKISWDAVFANTIAMPLQYVDSSVFRFLNNQCKGFAPEQKGWESYTDILAPLSNTHAVKLLPDTNFPKEKWRILHNGVDTEKFFPEEKEPGKIIWASSLDRGLHHLLGMFPKIRKKIPEANLHIFYDFYSIEYMAGYYYPGNSNVFDNTHLELGKRSRYILKTTKKMEGKGVHVHRSVSRSRIEHEMRTSQVLIYPLDPIYFTETFGVVVLEACASGTVPILVYDDAFMELWGGVTLGVAPPFSAHKDEFLDLVLRVLKDKDFRYELSKKCVSYAKNFEWGKLSRNLEECFRTRGEKGLLHPNFEL